MFRLIQGFDSDGAVLVLNCSASGRPGPVACQSACMQAAQLGSNQIPQYILNIGIEQIFCLVLVLRVLRVFYLPAIDKARIHTYFIE